MNSIPFRYQVNWILLLFEISFRMEITGYLLNQFFFLVAKFPIVYFQTQIKSLNTATVRFVFYNRGHMESTSAPFLEPNVTICRHTLDYDVFNVGYIGIGYNRLYL